MEKYLVTNLREEYQAALVGFVTAMYEWESCYYKKSIEAFSDDSLEEDLEKNMRRDLLAIFEKYVIDDGRNYDRVENIVCGRHPEYDLDNDEVELYDEALNAVSVVIRKKTGLGACFKLTLIMDDETCKIGKRELQSGKKWQRTYI